MRALSDALPTGHRAMANPTLQLHFGCGRATPPVSHSHNWPSGRMQNFLFKIGQKSYFFANKDPKTNFDDWMILQKHVLSFKCNDFFKMANLKAISSSATLIPSIKTWCTPRKKWLHVECRCSWHISCNRDMWPVPFDKIICRYLNDQSRFISTCNVEAAAS